MLATLILAAEAAAEGATKKEGIALLIPHPEEVVIGTIAFIVLFVLLAKFAFPALRKGLDQRAETIEGDLKRAEEAKLEAEQLLADYRAQLANAREEAARIIEEGRKTADELRKEMVAKAEDDSKAIVEAGRREVQNAMQAAQVDLRRQMAGLSVDLASKIVAKNLDAAAQTDLIDGFIAELDAAGSNA